MTLSSLQLTFEDVDKQRFNDTFDALHQTFNVKGLDFRTDTKSCVLGNATRHLTIERDEKFDGDFDPAVITEAVQYAHDALS